MSDVSDRHDLTGKIVIQGRTPVFIGSYSIVYSGNLNEQRVRQRTIDACFACPAYVLVSPR